MHDTRKATEPQQQSRIQISRLRHPRPTGTSTPGSLSLSPDPQRRRRAFKPQPHRLDVGRADIVEFENGNATGGAAHSATSISATEVGTVTSPSLAPWAQVPRRHRNFAATKKGPLLGAAL